MTIGEEFPSVAWEIPCCTEESVLQSFAVERVGFFLILEKTQESLYANPHFMPLSVEKRSVCMVNTDLETSCATGVLGKGK